MVPLSIAKIYTLHQGRFEEFNYRNSKVMKNYTAIIAAFAFLAGGCATANTGYYWENYSGTLYQYKQNPGPETRAKHVAELQKIINKASSKGSRVPPGIHAELGYMMAIDGDKATALAELQKEATIYPESKTFIERIYLMLGLGDSQ